MLAVCQPVGPGLRRDRADERRQESVAAEDADHDGRADRHAQGADRGQHAGDRSGRSPGSSNNVIATVPMIYPGAGRKVYPGFLQLAGFMTMNLGSHLISHWEMFKHLVVGDEESADATQEFYDEYRSVCDMTAEFYLQTVDVVFQRHLLPKGELKHRGRLVDPGGDPRHGAARDRRRARRYFGHRPDQGRARHRDQAADGEEAIFPRQGRRPLRHLQRPQVAREDRAGRREVHRRQRLSRSGGFFIFTPPSIVSATSARRAPRRPRTRTSRMWKPREQLRRPRSPGPRRAARSRSARRCARPRC